MDALNKVKVLTPNAHAYLDYFIVAALLMAPEVLGLSGFAETLAYVLGVAYLAVSLLTDFALGLFQKIQLKLHSKIELVVGLGLILLALVEGVDTATAQMFYSSMGAVILLAWTVTDFSHSN